MTSLIIAAALGGSIGASLRVVIVLKLGELMPGYLVGTAVANIIGCFVMGWSVAWLAQRGLSVGIWQAFIVSGILGSMTTFSAFAFEWWLLLRRDGFWLANGYAAAMMVCTLGALWLGESAFRRLVVSSAH